VVAVENPDILLLLNKVTEDDDKNCKPGYLSAGIETETSSAENIHKAKSETLYSWFVSSGRRESTCLLDCMQYSPHSIFIFKLM
jgi:hypothetical protein